jgi:hypothetical protein
MPPSLPPIWIEESAGLLQVHIEPIDDSLILILLDPKFRIAAHWRQMAFSTRDAFF